jgi:uncharacterized protein (TIGR03032 family)
VSDRLDRARAALHAGHDAALRRPVEVVHQWDGGAAVDPRLFQHRVRGQWWETLAAARVTLLVTREYEHLMIALSASTAGPRVTHLPLPHPSGIAFDPKRRVVHVASTRNPNQLFELAPARATRGPGESKARPLPRRPLVPVRSHVLPGGLYMHDLAMIGGTLHANAVARNCVVRFDASGGYRPVWWPRALDRLGAARFTRNHLQLNSIAAGPTLRASYFSASIDAPATRRPGHRNFSVDGRGVVFSGATREPIVRGLTRPHSARLHRKKLWIDNSGYGELGVGVDGKLDVVATLPGWTRGLGFAGDVAFVGTSRVLPRFSQYAPGLEPARCICGVHAVDARRGTVLGSIVWPFGNQIFAIEPVPARFTAGLPLPTSGRQERDLFYGFTTEREEDFQ